MSDGLTIKAQSSIDSNVDDMVNPDLDTDISDDTPPIDTGLE